MDVYGCVWWVCYCDVVAAKLSPWWDAYCSDSTSWGVVPWFKVKKGIQGFTTYSPNISWMYPPLIKPDNLIQKMNITTNINLDYFGWSAHLTFMSWFDYHWSSPWDTIAPAYLKHASTLGCSSLAGSCWICTVISWSAKTTFPTFPQYSIIFYQNIVVKCMARACFGLAQWTKTNGLVATSSAMQSINSNQNSNQNVAGISCFLSQCGRWAIVQSYPPKPPCTHFEHCQRHCEKSSATFLLKLHQEVIYHRCCANYFPEALATTSLSVKSQKILKSSWWSCCHGKSVLCI